VRWSDVDLQAGKLTIRRTLLKGGRSPVFGDTKTKTSRTIDLAAETITRLAAHRKHQAEIKLRNRLHYTDLGLVFAKEGATGTTGPTRSACRFRSTPSAIGSSPA
jgi:integrase